MRVDIRISDLTVLRAIQLATQKGPFSHGQAEIRVLSSGREMVERLRSNRCDVAVVEASGSSIPAKGQATSLLHHGHGPGRFVFIGRPGQDESVMLEYLRAQPLAILLSNRQAHEPGDLLLALARAWTQRTLSSALARRNENRGPCANFQVVALTAGWPPPQSVADMAAGIKMSTRTLRRRMRERCLSGPLDLLRVGRLLDAVALSRMGLRSAGHIASVMNLGGASTLRRLSRDLTGLAITEPFESDVEGLVVEGLVDRLLRTNAHDGASCN